MSTVKTIIELLRLVLAAYRFITGAISEHQYNSTVKERKKVFDKFMEAEDRAARLKALKEENEN